MACKHKSHAAYTRALEGLYIQTHLAILDLTDVMTEAREDNRRGSDAGSFLHLNQHRVRLAEERLTFGRTELADAEKVVDAHLGSGRCPGLPAIA